MSRSDDNSTELGISLIALGSGLFYNSLVAMKLRRRIQDTGTSRIATAALGESVEINGEVISDAESIISPLSNKSCVAFIWDIEKEVKTRKNRSWHLEHRFYSTPFIYVTDESKEVAAIDLSSCSFQENMYGKHIFFHEDTLNFPEGARALLQNYKMLAEKKSFFGSQKYRISEKIIKTGEKFFIHGAAALMPQSEIPQMKNGKNKFGKRHQLMIEKVKQTFRSKKQDPEMIRKFDLDQNGRLDEEETLTLYNTIEKNILDQYGIDSRAGLLKKAKFLFRGSKNEGSFFPLDTVCVSTKSEAELLSALGGKSVLYFFAGPGLVIAGLYFLWYDWVEKRSY